MGLCLGRLPRPPGARFLQLRKYDVGPLTIPPANLICPPEAIFGMYGNDRYGDCTIAAVANLASLQAAAEGRVVSFDDQAAIDYYLAMTGGQDVGANEVEVLGRVGKIGFPNLDGYRLRAFAGIDHANLTDVRRRAAQFTGIYVGAALPDNWADGVDARQWSDTSMDPNPDNGHAFILSGYGPDWCELVTWGMRLPATWDWWRKYVDEAYALLDDGRLSSDVLAGKQLLADAAALAAQTGAGG